MATCYRDVVTRRTVLIMGLLSACNTGVSPSSQGDAQQSSPSCVAAADHSDLEWIQREIFTPTCASFSACHKGRATSAGGLNLEAGNTLLNSVNVPSALFPEFVLVQPGAPASSYLFIILGGAPGPVDPDVGLMPLRSEPLCDAKVQAIGRWITGLGSETLEDGGLGDGGT